MTVSNLASSPVPVSVDALHDLLDETAEVRHIPARVRIDDACTHVRGGLVPPWCHDTAHQIAAIIDVSPFPTPVEVITAVDVAVFTWIRTRTTDWITHEDCRQQPPFECPDKAWCVRCFPNPYMLDPLQGLTDLVTYLVASRNGLLP